jgi:hypothetical protein
VQEDVEGSTYDIRGRHGHYGWKYFTFYIFLNHERSFKPLGNILEKTWWGPIGGGGGGGGHKKDIKNDGGAK